PFITDLAALLSALEDAMLPLLDVPYAIFGHSAGAFVALELCQHLRARGRPEPRKLVVSSIEPPEMLAFTLTPWARADIELVASYRYEADAPLDVPIHAIGGEGDLLAPVAALGGWARETGASFERTILPDHSRFDTQKPRFVEALCASLRAVLPAG